jgi:hypothetical protein
LLLKVGTADFFHSGSTRYRSWIVFAGGAREGESDPGDNSQAWLSKPLELKPEFSLLGCFPGSVEGGVGTLAPPFDMECSTTIGNAARKSGGFRPSARVRLNGYGVREP